MRRRKKMHVKQFCHMKELTAKLYNLGRTYNVVGGENIITYFF